ncbi:hypothetical protein EPI10_005821 [Gossypium australe]|uniref:Tf2-1-like SH3-like domain-containing protein n=1 Tax=Gossypium australe TaxID=47621 RepID=A0A5B6WS38_9ROSI|nr:hypothetical protein EPI10_005821 [Gossypium australe]
MFRNVSPQKKVLRFGCKGKLSPRLIGPYEVIERIGPVTRERIHDMFQGSMLQKYRSDQSHVVLIKEIKVRPDLTYEENRLRFWHIRQSLSS